MDFTGLSVLALLFWEFVVYLDLEGSAFSTEDVLKLLEVRHGASNGSDDEGMVAVF